MPADDLTDPAPATSFAHLDATTVLNRAISELGIYPAVDPLDSTSRMLDPRSSVRSITRSPATCSGLAALQVAAGHHRHSRHGRTVGRRQADVARARKIQRFLSSPSMSPRSSPARRAFVRWKTRSAASRPLSRRIRRPARSRLLHGRRHRGSESQGRATGRRRGVIRGPTMADYDAIRPGLAGAEPAGLGRSATELSVIPGARRRPDGDASCMRRRSPRCARAS